MKKIFYIIIALVVLIAVGVAVYVSFFSEEEETEEIVVDKVIEKPQSGPQKMNDDRVSSDITWISNARYSYTITRHSSENLPKVTNHDDVYFDNTVDLVVKRADGTVFFEKTYSKENFAPALPKQVYDAGVLLGMSFEKAENNKLYFVVSIGSPDESVEEFYYVQLIIDNFGNSSCSAYNNG